MSLQAICWGLICEKTSLRVSGRQHIIHALKACKYSHFKNRELCIYIVFISFI